MKFRTVFMVALACVTASPRLVIAAEPIRIIPQPTSVTAGSGEFTLNASTAIRYTSAPLADEAQHLADFLLARLTTISTPVEQAGTSASNAVILDIDASQTHAEGYTMSVTGSQILITGKDEAGVFYGIQTLKQLMPASFFVVPTTKGTEVKITTAAIIDYPRFGWRGNHIDLSRHWHGLDDLKRMVELMALHKMNRFQLHLTDDQGWRIQIDAFPKLTTDAAWRAGNIASLPSAYFRGDGQYGGFLSKTDVAALVAFAQAHHVELIPEIDLPGHMGAAFSAYPNVLNGSTDSSGNVTQTNYGNLAPWDAECMDFFYKVFEEVADMFPGKYFHLGGDEFGGYGGWTADGNNHTEVGNWFTAESLRTNGATGSPSGEKVHGWMFKKIQEWLVSHRAIQGGVTPRIIGWHETHEGSKEPPSNTIAMRWTGNSASSANGQLADGYEVIMAQEFGFYFNYSIESKTFFPGYGYNTQNTLEKAYNWIAVDPAATNQQNILGLQCSMWTEAIFDQWAWDHTLFPRLCTTAEKGWSPLASKNFSDFTDRLYNAHDDRLDALGVAFNRNQPAITGLPQTNVLSGIHVKRAAFNDHLDIALPSQPDNGDTYRYLWENKTEIFDGAYRFVIPETGIPVYEVADKMTANRSGTMAVARQRRDGAGVSHPVHIQVEKANVAPARLVSTEAGMWKISHSGNFSHGNALDFLRLPATGATKISTLSGLPNQTQNSALEVTAILNVSTTGTYNFRLTATGASTLRLGNMVLCTQGKTEDIHLKAGQYPITITNVVSSGTPSVQAEIRTPGGSWTNFGSSPLIKRSTTFIPRSSSYTVGKTATTSNGGNTTAAFDGNPSTNWIHTGQNIDAWLEVDLGSPQLVNGYAIHTVGRGGFTLGGSGVAVSRVHIEYKDATNQWQVLTTDKTATAAQACELPSVKARYFRAHLVSPNENPGIAIFDLYGPSQTGALAITRQPGKTTILSGGTANMRVHTNAGTGTLSYQWYEGTSGDTSSPIAGQTTSELNFVAAGESNKIVWLRIIDSSGSVDSNTTVIEISQPDRDGDELSDALEATLGTDPDNKDTDSDGFHDGTEHYLGTDPKSSANKPQLISVDLESGSNTFTGTEPTSGHGNIWNAATGQFYTSGALTDPSWSNLFLSDTSTSPVDFTITGKVAFYNFGGNALYNDYLFVGAGGADSSVTYAIKDLIPSRPFILLASGSGNRDMPMTVNGQSGAAPASNHWRVKTTANAQGQITGTLSSPGGEKNLGGFQLLGKWLQASGLDSDGDGVPDEIEQALGATNGTGATFPAITSVTHNSLPKQSFGIDLTQHGADKLVIEYSTDLTNWYNPETTSHAAIVSVKNSATWTLYMNMASSSRIFVRLKLP